MVAAGAVAIDTFVLSHLCLDVHELAGGVSADKTGLTPVGGVSGVAALHLNAVWGYCHAVLPKLAPVNDNGSLAKLSTGLPPGVSRVLRAEEAAVERDVDWEGAASVGPRPNPGGDGDARGHLLLLFFKAFE